MHLQIHADRFAQNYTAPAHCDTLGACSQQQLHITVHGHVKILPLASRLCMPIGAFGMIRAGGKKNTQNQWSELLAAMGMPFTDATSKNMLPDREFNCGTCISWVRELARCNNHVCASLSSTRRPKSMLPGKEPNDGTCARQGMQCAHARIAPRLQPSLTLLAPPSHWRCW